MFCLVRREPESAENDDQAATTGTATDKETTAAAAAAAEEVVEKRQRVDDAERTWLLLREAAAGASVAGSKTGDGGDRDAKQEKEKGWLARYSATIIGNLIVTVTNVHVRYEDDITTPGHPFAAGMTIARLAAITVDERGAESFVSSDSFSRVRKRVQLERLAIYFDTHQGRGDNGHPHPDGNGEVPTTSSTDETNADVRWVPEGGWESMGPDNGDTWWKLFGPGIQAEKEGHGSESGSGGGGVRGNDGRRGSVAAGRQHLLHPVSGELIYVRKGVKDPSTPGEPRQLLDLRMGSVRTTLRRRQFRDITRLLDVFTTHQMRAPHVHLRPAGCQRTATVAPRAWWAYAFAALALRRRVAGPGSGGGGTSSAGGALWWESLAEGARRRRRHNQLFLTSPGDAAAAYDIAREVRDIEAQVPYEVALTWRCLAHASLPRNLAAALAASSSSADLSTSSSTSPPASVSSSSPGGGNKPMSPALSLALSARKTAAAALTSGGATASRTSRTGVQTMSMFSKVELHSSPECTRVETLLD